MSELARFDAEQEMLAAQEMRARGWVPYRERGPQTDDLNVLRAYLHEVRERNPRGSFEGAEAYNRLAKAASRAGTPLDGLRQYARNEAERFFARTVPGPDGHVYWNWGRDIFARNDHKVRPPGRWWWEHVHGPINDGTLWVRPKCGDAKCIAVEHAECFRPDRTIYTDEKILGAIQVFALKHGRAPTRREWSQHGMKPSYDILRNRFGSYSGAIRAAGLRPRLRGGRGTTPDECIASLRRAKEILGRWPTQADYRNDVDLRSRLADEGFPSSRQPMYTHLGKWDEALRKAGKK